MKTMKQWLYLGLVLPMFLMVEGAWAVSTVGTVMESQGSVRVGGKAVSGRAEVHEGDTVTTGSGSEALLRMTDGTTMAVRPNSQLKVKDYRFVNDEARNSDNHLLVNLIKGGLRVVTGLIGKRNPTQFRVATPTATIGVRGTDFEVAVVEKGRSKAEAGTYNKVFSGATFLESQGRQVDIAAGQVAFSPADALQMAKRFGLLRQVPNVFFDGRYDNLLNALQDEAIHRLEHELGAQLPHEVRRLLPKLGDILKGQEE